MASQTVVGTINYISDISNDSSSDSTSTDSTTSNTDSDDSSDNEDYILRLLNIEEAIQGKDLRIEILPASEYRKQQLNENDDDISSSSFFDGSTDSGPESHDSGPESHDSGPESHDNGPESHDNGTESHDNGPESHDSGPESHDKGLESPDSELESHFSKQEHNDGVLENNDDKPEQKDIPENNGSRVKAVKKSSSYPNETTKDIGQQKYSERGTEENSLEKCSNEQNERTSYKILFKPEENSQCGNMSTFKDKPHEIFGTAIYEEVLDYEYDEDQPTTPNLRQETSVNLESQSILQNSEIHNFNEHVSKVQDILKEVENNSEPQSNVPETMTSDNQNVSKLTKSAKIVGNCKLFGNRPKYRIDLARKSRNHKSPNSDSQETDRRPSPSDSRMPSHRANQRRSCTFVCFSCNIAFRTALMLDIHKIGNHNIEVNRTDWTEVESETLTKHMEKGLNQNSPLNKIIEDPFCSKQNELKQPSHFSGTPSKYFQINEVTSKKTKEINKKTRKSLNKSSHNAQIPKYSSKQLEKLSVTTTIQDKRNNKEITLKPNAPSSSNGKPFSHVSKLGKRNGDLCDKSQLDKIENKKITVKTNLPSSSFGKPISHVSKSGKRNRGICDKSQQADAESSANYSGSEFCCPSNENVFNGFCSKRLKSSLQEETSCSTKNIQDISKTYTTFPVIDLATSLAVADQLFYPKTNLNSRKALTLNERIRSPKKCLVYPTVQKKTSIHLPNNSTFFESNNILGNAFSLPEKRTREPKQCVVYPTIQKKANSVSGLSHNQRSDSLFMTQQAGFSEVSGQTSKNKATFKRKLSFPDEGSPAILKDSMISFKKCKSGKKSITAVYKKQVPSTPTLEESCSLKFQPVVFLERLKIDTVNCLHKATSQIKPQNIGTLVENFEDCIRETEGRYTAKDVSSHSDTVNIVSYDQAAKAVTAVSIVRTKNSEEHVEKTEERAKDSLEIASLSKVTRQINKDDTISHDTTTSKLIINDPTTEDHQNESLLKNSEYNNLKNLNTDFEEEELELLLEDTEDLHLVTDDVEECHSEYFEEPGTNFDTTELFNLDVTDLQRTEEPCSEKHGSDIDTTKEYNLDVTNFQVPKPNVLKIEHGKNRNTPHKSKNYKQNDLHVVSKTTEKTSATFSKTTKSGKVKICKDVSQNNYQNRNDDLVLNAVNASLRSSLNTGKNLFKKKRQSENGQVIVPKEITNTIVNHKNGNLVSKCDNPSFRIISFDRKAKSALAGCPYCRKFVGTNVWHIKEHIVQVHKFKCLPCKKSFESQEHLSNHKYLQHCRQLHECIVCDEVFIEKYHFQTHERSKRHRMMKFKLRNILENYLQIDLPSENELTQEFTRKKDIINKANPGLTLVPHCTQIMKVTQEKIESACKKKVSPLSIESHIPTENQKPQVENYQNDISGALSEKDINVEVQKDSENNQTTDVGNVACIYNQNGTKCVFLSEVSKFVPFDIEFNDRVNEILDYYENEDTQSLLNKTVNTCKGFLNDSNTNQPTETTLNQPSAPRDIFSTAFNDNQILGFNEMELMDTSIQFSIGSQESFHSITSSQTEESNSAEVMSDFLSYEIENHSSPIVTTQSKQCSIMDNVTSLPKSSSTLEKGNYSLPELSLLEPNSTPQKEFSVIELSFTPEKEISLLELSSISEKEPSSSLDKRTPSFQPSSTLEIEISLLKSSSSLEKVIPLSETSSTPETQISLLEPSSSLEGTMSQPSLPPEKEFLLYEPIFSLEKGTLQSQPSSPLEKEILLLEPNSTSEKEILLFEPSLASKKETTLSEPSCTSEKEISLLEPCCSLEKETSLSEPTSTPEEKISVLEKPQFPIEVSNSKSLKTPTKNARSQSDKSNNWNENGFHSGFLMLDEVIYDIPDTIGEVTIDCSPGTLNTPTYEGTESPVGCRNSSIARLQRNSPFTWSSLYDSSALDMYNEEFNKMWSNTS